MRQNTVFTNPLNEPFYLQIRPNGEDCNTSCRYCRYESAEYTWGNRAHMSKKLLEKIIREQINAQPSKSVVFAWEGGEPLLSGIDFFRDAVRLQRRIADDKIVLNILETNGLLINDQWCQFFKENNFFVYVFLDGPEHCHSYYRSDRKNGNTFSKVISAINLLKKHRVDFVARVSVTQYSVNYPLEIYHFLKDLGVQFIHFNPLAHWIVKEDKGFHFLLPGEKGVGELAEWSVSSLAYGKFLTTIFDEWVRNDVGERYIKLFDATLTALIGKRSLEICEFSRSCRNRLLVNFDGSAYQCNQYISPEYKLGDLNTQPLLAIAHSSKRAELADRKLKRTCTTCRDCDMLAICNGYCTRTRFDNIDGCDHGHTYYCQGLKYYFNHVRPYMDFMANELKHDRPPANVMEFARERDKKI